MPFSSEFLRMARGKMDPIHQKSSPFSADPSYGADDCFELVLENGQIMMQGQPSRSRKGSVSNNLPLQDIHKAGQDIKHADNSKLSKLSSTIEPLPNDFVLFAPTFEMGLDNEELVSWFDYSVTDEPFNHGDSCSDLLPELSGVTMNGFSGGYNIIPSVVSQSKFVAANASTSSYQEEIIPNAVPTAKENSNEFTAKEMQNQHHLKPRSGNSDLAISDICNPNPLDLKTSIQMGGSSVTKLQNVSDEKHHNMSTATNFSYFSQFTTASSHDRNLVANTGPPPPPPCTTVKLGNEDKWHIWSGSTHTEANPTVGFSQRESKFDGQTSLNAVKESVAPNVLKDPPHSRQVLETVCSDQDNAPPDNVKRDKTPELAIGSTPGSGDGNNGDEKISEPTVIASSVCSGNSIERVSNDPSSNYFKRKLSDTGESESPNEEVEEDSVGVRKISAAHTGGLKRSRTAQVHNLSERRRRDRINEKMRALQELLPNCNKADKASMLEEAIEYLKTLQLQVQMLSMGATMYMPPMMVPAVMHHRGQMPYFPQMPISAMGMGIGMQELNNGMMQMPYMPSPCYTFSGGPSQVPCSSNLNCLSGATNKGFVHPAGQQVQTADSNDMAQNVRSDVILKDNKTNSSVYHGSSQAEVLHHNQIAQSANNAVEAQGGSTPIPS